MAPSFASSRKPIPNEGADLTNQRHLDRLAQSKLKQEQEALELRKIADEEYRKYYSFSLNIVGIGLGAVLLISFAMIAYQIRHEVTV
ncbi:uncharacterized protein SPAPADRAFT_60921 [Spathaspora passalidarum NRRL Y-27907]|uniref:Uncharacterized protein n=1 Tax=Spathaspora passalidarum (strain NRRL Y-27907 / 11-Y1) TaxID=619300 RepID=G3AKB9_SPAPN|nr:uncharacterized protein SPAPADRAFT_60921 [Spathaspora passalidarum NRRL Y-27907]EGW33578.1 hypothetical protein SPAPADRAFT_60921 [Spathaspora passalidarum NRRL Y-27907]